MADFAIAGVDACEGNWGDAAESAGIGCCELAVPGSGAILDGAACGEDLADGDYGQAALDGAGAVAGLF